MTDLSTMLSRAFQEEEPTYEKFIEKLKNSGYNTDNLEEFLQTEDNILGLALAGGGKTTVITLKLLIDNYLGKMVKDTIINGVPRKVSKKVLITTFSRTGAMDLETTLQEESNKVGISYLNKETRFATLHSTFLYIMQQKLNVKVNIIQGGEQYKLVREVLAEYGIANGYPTNNDVSHVIGAISYMNNRVDYRINQDASDKVYQTVLANIHLERLGITNKSFLDMIIKRYQELKDENNWSDFDDLQTMLYNYAVNPETRNPHVAKALSLQYDYIIIDEFQDVSQIQYEILKVMAQGDTTVIAVGDDDQSIYGFRGSDVDIILNRYPKDFEPKVIKLDTSFRCPKNVLDVAKTLIKHNKSRYNKEMKSIKPGGVVKATGYSNFMSMVEGTQQEIVGYLNEGHTVTVLGGTNFDFQPLAVYLDITDEFDFRIGGTLFELTRAKYKNIYKILSLLDVDCDLASVLRDLTNVIPHFKAKTLEKELRLRNIPPLQFPVKNYYDIHPVLGEIMQDLQSVYINGSNNNLSMAEVMIDILYAYKNLMAREVVKEKKDLDVIMNTLITILKYHDSEIETYKDFLLVVSKVNQRLIGHTQDHRAKLLLTTIHDYKGLEADHIIGFNIVEGSLPRDAVLKIPNEEVKAKELEEERRLAYIMVTRAKETMTVATNVNDKPSRFIEEMGLPIQPYIPQAKKSKFIDKAKEMEQTMDIGTLTL